MPIIFTPIPLSSRSGRACYTIAALSLLLTAGNPVLGNGTAAASLTTPVLQDSGGGDSSPAMAPVTGGAVRCTNGKALVYDCGNVDLVSFLPAEAIGGTTTFRFLNVAATINDMWGWTDSATGREFAIVGRVDGTAFVEVTDPVNPKYLGDLPRPEGSNISLWRDLKVYNNHVFVVSEAGGGIQVFDLAQLLSVENPPTIFAETARYDGVDNVHNIIIDTATGFAYTTKGGKRCGGMQIVDIRDPARPTFAGCSPLAGHDAQCVVYHGPDRTYHGREICVHALGKKGIGIIDVTDKRHPKTVGVASYPNVAFAHQGWFTDDQRYFFLGDEGDESTSDINTRTIVFDLSTLSDPVVAREFFGTTSTTDHNLYIRGRYVYQANYLSGLRILDITDPVNPKEVGYFGTTTQDAKPHAAKPRRKSGSPGAWSNYPFFKSGVIGISSSGEGLFLVNFNPPRP